MDDLDLAELRLKTQRAGIDVQLAAIAMARAARKATASFQRLGMRLAALEIASADEGEFANRVHDFISE